MSKIRERIVGLHDYMNHVSRHPFQMIAQLLLVIALIVIIVIAYTNPSIFGTDGTPILLAVLALVYLGVSLQGIQRYCEQKRCVTTSTLLMHLFNTGTGGLFGMILFVFVPPDVKNDLLDQLKELKAQSDLTIEQLKEEVLEAKTALEEKRAAEQNK
jgi:cellobiose-specific phosphotransferase system component IIC